MYINMVASRLLIPIHCTYMEIFLKEAGIISTEMNVIFDKFDKVLRYDLKNASEQLGINEDWKPRNQVIIDQRKRQLK